MDNSTEILDRLAGRKSNEAQELNLELMRIASFNAYDGEKVVKSLKRNRNLWKAVVMDRAHYIQPICLIKLRDLPDSYWNVDTVYILPALGQEEKLLSIVKRWKANEIDWIEGEQAQSMLGGGGPNFPNKLLRVWWD